MKNKYYIQSSELIGPNRDETLNTHIVEITTNPPKKNLSGTVEVCGWLGTTNNVDMYSHGEFDSLDSARKNLFEIFPETREKSDVDLEDGVVEAYCVGEYHDMNEEDTENWIYAGLKSDLFGKTEISESEIDHLYDEYEDAANAEGLSLDYKKFVEVAEAIISDLIKK